MLLHKRVHRITTSHVWRVKWWHVRVLIIWIGCEMWRVHWWILTIHHHGIWLSMLSQVLRLTSFFGIYESRSLMIHFDMLKWVLKCTKWPILSIAKQSGTSLFLTFFTWWNLFFRNFEPKKEIKLIRFLTHQVFFFYPIMSLYFRAAIQNLDLFLCHFLLWVVRPSYSSFVVIIVVI